jgi:hypothetical protein
MTKRKTSITVDGAKADVATSLAGTSSFSETVDRALDALIREEQARRDLDAYERLPLTDDEAGLAQGQLVGDPTDDTDWASLYQDIR